MKIKINEHESYTIELDEEITVQELSVVIDRLKVILKMGDISKIFDNKPLKIRSEKNYFNFNDKALSLEVYDIYLKKNISAVRDYLLLNGFTSGKAPYNVIEGIIKRYDLPYKHKKTKHGE